MFVPRVFVGMWLLVSAAPVLAGDVNIEAVEFERQSGAWRIAVTLRHADAGWDHYADEWRVVDAQGNVLGQRVLYHPHVDEQPFTRSQAGITIPPETKVVYVEAHDKVHGWSKDRVAIDLGKAQGERYRIR